MAIASATGGHPLTLPCVTKGVCERLDGWANVPLYQVVANPYGKLTMIPQRMAHVRACVWRRTCAG